MRLLLEPQIVDTPRGFYVVFDEINQLRPFPTRIDARVATIMEHAVWIAAAETSG